MTTPRNDILLGDVWQKLGKLDNESVNCIITSPPYWSLRKYDIPDVVWDGEEGCEHEWGDKIIKIVQPGRDCSGGYSGRDLGTRGNQGSAAAKGMEASQGQFCLHCHAWRGQLGLEPTIDLYLSHLMQIMDECKRVLRDDGTMWVNLGDTYSGQKIGNTESFKNPKVVRNDFIKHKQNIPTKSLCLIPERFSIEMVNRGWILRNKIVWHKPNCMPSSVKDRFTVDWEPVYFFVKSKKYWFDQLTEPSSPNSTFVDKTDGLTPSALAVGGVYTGLGKGSRGNSSGRNRRCVWTIPTQPYPESHFATFPEKLVTPMIEAGCPQGGLVLDPFIGSGTVAKVAQDLGRDFLGIESGEKYVEMAWRRIMGIKIEDVEAENV